MLVDDVRRVFLGSFVRPAAETGTGQLRVEAVYGYLVRHHDGYLLLDTGLGRGDDETEEWYRPRRIPLPEALRAHGLGLADLRWIANCHLHFDHCGGNPLVPGRPVFTQRAELAAARAGGYTFDDLVEYAGATYELLDGEAEVLPGVSLVPTPGHVDGHQSLVVRCDDGTVILAGQAHDMASGWSADVLAARARDLGHGAPLPTESPWMHRLLDLDPRRVFFAHDSAVWEPS